MCKKLMVVNRRNKFKYNKNIDFSLSLFLGVG